MTVEAFKAANPEYADMTVDVQPVGEGDAASKVITDVDAAADIFDNCAERSTHRDFNKTGIIDITA